jgi:hypothetical protein
MSPMSSFSARKKDAGRVTRVPAIQLEKLVVEAIRAEARPDTESKGDYWCASPSIWCWRDHATGVSNRRATPIPRGSRPSTAA